MATWAGEPGSALIVRGQARLLEDITAIEDLERVRILFDALERGESFARLLELANSASGVQIFIGADSPLFANTGCSMVVAPFRDSQERILGAIGVIGPTRLNYARIIPLVDYTARTIGRVAGASRGRTNGASSNCASDVKSGLLRRRSSMKFTKTFTRAGRCLRLR